jgi:hypothetical protein
MDSSPCSILRPAEGRLKASEGTLIVKRVA